MKRHSRLILSLLLVVVVFVAFRQWSGGGERIAASDFASRPAHSVVVDVRTPAEFASGHLAGAVNVDLFGDFEAQMGAFDRARPVYLYCASGTRSGRAASKLERLGFATVVNAGGYASLVEAGAATEP
jgi:phage shock protein E